MNNKQGILRSQTTHCMLVQSGMWDYSCLHLRPHVGVQKHVRGILPSRWKGIWDYIVLMWVSLLAIHGEHWPHYNMMSFAFSLLKYRPVAHCVGPRPLFVSYILIYLILVYGPQKSEKSPDVILLKNTYIINVRT